MDSRPEKQGRKRKKLVLEAVGEDTCLGGYKAAVYPLLRSFGLFDELALPRQIDLDTYH